MDNTIAVFEEKKIRQIEHDGVVYFSVVDIIEILTDSPAPRQYWNVLKKREAQLSTICLQLKLTANDGCQRQTDCSNTEGVLRIIQSVPSPKAAFFIPSGKIIVNKTKINNTLNSTPLRPPPTTNHPSLK